MSQNLVSLYVRRGAELRAIRYAHILSLREAGEWDAIKRGFKVWKQWREKRKGGAA